MKWINVNELIPVYGRRVLLCVEGYKIPRHIVFGTRTATTIQGEQYDVTGDVTYWAPQPELPTKE